MATFVWVPFNPPSVKYGHRVLESVFENGKKQKKYKGPLPTTWELAFKTTRNEMMAIRDFFNARRGSFEPFTWVDQWSGATRVVRFAENELELETEFMLNGMFSVRLEEVL
nr:hypothetical protein [uncultured Dethiosulfovibrio sp.]